MIGWMKQGKILGRLLEKVFCKKGEFMKVSKDEICAVRTAKNNITKHVYDIGDYKLCKKESEVVGRALKLYLQQLERMDKSFHEIQN